MKPNSEEFKDAEQLCDQIVVLLDKQTKHIESLDKEIARLKIVETKFDAQCFDELGIIAKQRKRILELEEQIATLRTSTK